MKKIILDYIKKNGAISPRRLEEKHYENAKEIRETVQTLLIEGLLIVNDSYKLELLKG